MKTLKCDLCEVTAHGETFEEWMKNLMPHYQEAHVDVMNEHKDDSDEEKRRLMMEWMNENKTRFEAAADHYIL